MNEAERVKAARLAAEVKKSRLLEATAATIDVANTVSRNHPYKVCGNSMIHHLG